MSTHAESLADQFLHENDELVRLAERCSDAQWRMTCDAEGWTVGVTIHHVAADYLDLLAVIDAIVGGRAVPSVTREGLDERNSRHAERFAGCSKGETVALLRHNAATVANAIRALSDDQLARSGTLLGRDVAVEHIIRVSLMGHIESHMTSVRAAL